MPSPACPSPDGRLSKRPPFDFRRLGVRVPAVRKIPADTLTRAFIAHTYNKARAHTHTHANSRTHIVAHMRSAGFMTCAGRYLPMDSPWDGGEPPCASEPQTQCALRALLSAKVSDGIGSCTSARTFDGRCASCHACVSCGRTWQDLARAVRPQCNPVDGPGALRRPIPQARPEPAGP